MTLLSGIDARSRIFWTSYRAAGHSYRLTGRFSTSSSSARVSSSIFGVSWSSKSRRSCRRRPMSQCQRLQFTATCRPPQRFLASQTFVERHHVQLIHHAVLICTNRRYHSSWLRSRFSASGTKSDLVATASATTAHPGDRSSAFGLVSCESGLRLNPQLKLQVDRQTLEPACVPAGFHPYPDGQTTILEIAVELLRLFGESGGVR